MYANLELFIDGQWLNGDGRRGENVINPATEKPLAHLPPAVLVGLSLSSLEEGCAVAGGCATICAWWPFSL